MPLISACGRLNQENGELETRVNYIARLCREEEGERERGKEGGQGS